VIIRRVSLENFRWVKEGTFEFGTDFTCLLGGNGEGKTTVLDAISLCCSSLDFAGEIGAIAKGEDWSPTATPKQRRDAYLRRNVRAFRDNNPTGFRVETTMEHEGETLEVVLTEKGFERNDILEKPWWWAGLTYYAKFDSDMVNFQLRHDLWPAFADAFEGVTGIPVEPEVMTDDELEELGEDSRVVTGFFLLKGGLRIPSRYASSGEKKIGKTLSQVVNLEKERLPHVVLVDEIERHVHYKRHLAMLENLKRIFAGMQVIATTHSTVVMDRYEPRSHLLDVEEACHAHAGNRKGK